MKQCSKCKEYKNGSEFYKDSKLKDGLFNSCKICVSQQSKQYYNLNKDKYKEYRKRQNESGYLKRYYQNYKDKFRKRNKEYYYDNKEKFREYAKQRRLKHPTEYKIPIELKCKVCGTEIITVQFNQKYCKGCKPKIRSRKSDIKRRNLKWKILFDNPFDKTENVHYHHVNEKFVIPLPADIHSCYFGYHTRNDNTDLDYIIEQIYPSFNIVKDSIRNNHC